MFGCGSIAETPFCTCGLAAPVVVTPTPEQAPNIGTAVEVFGFGTPDGRRRKREIDIAITVMMRQLME